MSAPIVFICIGGAFARLHLERELLHRAESLGVTLAPMHYDDSSDASRPRVNVGTIGHVEYGDTVLVSAIAKSFRLADDLFEVRPEPVLYNTPSWTHQFAKIRNQHDQDSQRKSRLYMRPMRNFCYRRK